jgi:hypothetical protein
MKTVNDPGVKILGTVGDADPIEYGGGYIIEEDGKIRIEYFYGLDIDKPNHENKFNVYYVTIEPNILSYCNWITKEDLEQIAHYIGYDITALKKLSDSKDPSERAVVLGAIASYFGWDNLDQYPMKLTEKELRIRWDIPV